MENKITPVQIMKEVERFMEKLKEMGCTKVDLVVARETSIVAGQLVVKFSLKTDKGLEVATYTKVFEEPVEDLKAKMQAKKEVLQNNIQKDIDELNEVITAIDGA